MGQRRRADRVGFGEYQAERFAEGVLRIKQAQRVAQVGDNLLVRQFAERDHAALRRDPAVQIAGIGHAQAHCGTAPPQRRECFEHLVESLVRRTQKQQFVRIADSGVGAQARRNGIVDT